MKPLPEHACPECGGGVYTREYTSDVGHVIGEDIACLGDGEGWWDGCEWSSEYDYLAQIAYWRRKATLLAAGLGNLELVELVAEFIADTDAPLGEKARAAIAKAKGEGAS